MKHSLLLAVLSIGLLSGCSTSFKAGQTPDDVYYSPGREIASAKDEEVQKKDNQQYQEYVSSMDDRYLRMKVANRYRWGIIDNYDYWYDSRYDFSSYYYNAYNPYSTWNPCWNKGYYGYGNTGYYYGNIGWNNPYYTVISYTTPTKQTGGYTAGSNITAYKNKIYNNANYGYKDPKTGAFVPSSNNNSFGNLLKRVFTGSADYNTSSSFDRPVRTYTTPSTTSTPAPATSSSAGGTSGGYQSTGSSTSTGRGGRGG